MHEVWQAQAAAPCAPTVHGARPGHQGVGERVKGQGTRLEVSLAGPTGPGWVWGHQSMARAGSYKGEGCRVRPPWRAASLGTLDHKRRNVARGRLTVPP